MSDGKRDSKVPEQPPEGGKPGQRRTFAQHLEHASSVVRDWPAWKQQLLGGEASSQPQQRCPGLEGRS
jgi:hypothetical protein